MISALMRVSFELKFYQISIRDARDEPNSQNSKRKTKMNEMNQFNRIVNPLTLRMAEFLLLSLFTILTILNSHLYHPKTYSGD